MAREIRKKGESPVFAPTPPLESLRAVISLAATAADRAERIARQDVPPGGVLFGDSDRIVPPVPQMTALAGLGWSTRVASGRGHMIPLTDPETCAALIRDLNRSTLR